ncbi:MULTISPECIES: AAA family ATPase [Acinetobacter calcoaceticus/baumannii complex]|jgi:predicted ATPase|uniref:AAA family ATPase n=1 Tax=Acinetobacter calcoaceticus/baumannii complex TaxID=909768 RepID=UPI0029534D99|nr:AAA family ATPase [Acinetobacter pittii]MDV8151886.1 AAA family ATPase [Acinetobacter pittii]
MVDDTQDKQISRILIEGYKSIEKCDLDLNTLNVLIGANGAGKSNLISFFKLIGKIVDEQLQLAVGEAGGPDAVLHFGRKKTEKLKAEIYFGNNGYKFSLIPTQDNRMMFEREALWWNVSGDWRARSGHFESYISEQKNRTNIYNYVVPAMMSWTLYHFHDTSSTATVKQIHNIGDNEYLRQDAKNLAAFLYRLKQQHESHYKRIVKTIRLVAPFFGDFYLRPTVSNSEKIQLEWTETGQDEPFTASALSDGTLRFICLVTVLLQPDEFMPATILIDEPELGLHPYAIKVLAGLIKSISIDHQIIISTQSVELLDEFEAKDLIVVDKINGNSNFKRLDVEKLSAWLDEYSLGELWKKNVIGGRPNR